MKYSIWHILVALFIIIGIIGIFFVFSISLIFYKFNIKERINEYSAHLHIIGDAIAGPSWTVKISYPGTVENIMETAGEMQGVKFVRIINENNILEKTNIDEPINIKIENPPVFQRDTNIRDGLWENEPIKEFSLKSRDGTNLWMGVSFEPIKNGILSVAILIGQINLFLFIIIAIIVFLLAQKIIIKPLLALSDAFEQIKNKNYDIHLKEINIIEPQKVFNSFNQTVEKIKKAENLLKEELGRTKEIDKLKSEFISIAAHQLRTPLSAVKWAIKLLIDEDLGKLNAEQKTFLMQGYQSNERMIKLVNDFLNVVRIEEGRFGYQFIPIQLEYLIEEIENDFTPEIQRKKIKYTLEKSSQPLPPVQIDPARLRLAIQNLIDNAIKYTPENGNVTISIKQDKMYLEVMIKDTGVGIPKNQQEKIFDKFFRGDNVIRSQTYGTGLGLFIVKNIIEAHGGKIWFGSEENKGTTFYFTIPLAKQII